MRPGLLAALNEMGQVLGGVDAKIAVLANKVAAHEAVLAAMLRHQDEDTVRAVRADLEKIFRQIDDEGFAEATKGVWRTAGLDWPDGD